MKTHVTTIDLMRQNTNMLNGSAFRESIERSIVVKRNNELHVDNGVCQHRYETVPDRHDEQEFESGNILRWPEPENHVGFFRTEKNLERENENEIDCVFCLWAERVVETKCGSFVVY